MREKPQYLKNCFDSIEEVTEDISLIDVWLYVDEDDFITRKFIDNVQEDIYSFKRNWVIGERTKSQGRMYNILWERCTTNPGIYMVCTDDYLFITKFWDNIVREIFNRYSDRILIAHAIDQVGPKGIASFPFLSAEWINILGRIFSEFFPFWFDDIWLSQVAMMVQRKFSLNDIQMKPQGGGRRLTLRMKNLSFWYKFFLNTMEERIEEANILRKVIYRENSPEYNKSVKEGNRLIKRFMTEYDTCEESLCSMERQFSNCQKNLKSQTDNFYLLSEINAVNYLCKKIGLLLNQGALIEALAILDNLLYASPKVKVTQYLNPFLLNNRNIKANILIGLASVFAQHGKFKKAEEELEKALFLNPANIKIRTKILLNTAVLHIKQQKFTEAEEKLQRLLSLGHDKDEVILIHYTFGSNYEREGLIKKAKENFEAAIKLANKVPFSENRKKYLGSANFHLGCVYNKNFAKKQLAKHHFEECLKFIPNHRRASQELSSIYYADNFIPGRSKKRKNYILAYCNLGTTYEKEGFLNEAKESFETVLRLTDKAYSLLDRYGFLGGAHFHLGCIHQRIGEEEKAKYHFEECLQFLPGHKKASMNLILIYSETGLVPKHKKKRRNYAVAYYNLGSTYEKEGFLNEAKESFETVLKFTDKAYFLLDKTSFLGGAHFHLGCIYRRIGEEEKAKSHFEECLQFIPNHGKARRNLSPIYLHNKANTKKGKKNSKK